jgi:hypothetical protein
MTTERRKKGERRKTKRRKPLDEKGFRKIIEKDKASPGDKRSWSERRKKKRRKRQMGI